MIRQAVIVVAADPAGVAAATARVAGLPLVVRQALTLARAGVTQVYVVGPALEPVVPVLERAAPSFARAGIAVEAVVAAGPVALVERLRGPFLLVSGDRVFDPALVARLGAADLERAELHAAVDTSRGGAEVGLWAASPELLDALAARSSVPLAEGMAALTAAGRAATLDVAGTLWEPAADADGRRRAERALFRSLRKPHDGWVSRHLNRPLSLAVTRLLLGTNITPNQMTIVATLFGIAGIVVVAQATWTAVAVGALLVHLQSVLDGCDGELARLKFRSSRFGEWLDNVLDDLVNASYGVALGFAASALLGDPRWRLLGLGAAAAIAIYNLVVYAQLALVHKTGNPFAFRWWFQTGTGDVQAHLARGSGPGGRLAALLHSLARRDVFLFAFFLLAVARLPHVAVLWYAVVCAGYFVMVVLHAVNGGMPAPAHPPPAGATDAKVTR